MSSTRGEDFPTLDSGLGEKDGRPREFNWRDYEPSQIQGGQRFAEELTTYRDHLDELLADHSGEFVIIKGTRIVGFFKERDDATRAAFDEFGREPVLIRVVVEKEPIRYLGRTW